ncbi:MAG: hypothetical protein GY764_07525 [Halieaceae bacterium]|nr:hypothetical protein [Halieaceae bacterium]
MTPSGEFWVKNVTIQDGVAPQGGGILNLGHLIVTNSTFSGNSASSISGGGGISSAGTLTVTNSTFSGNSTTSFSGGAIVTSGLGTTTVTYSTFYNNSALVGGGAISADLASTVNLAGNIFEDGPSGSLQCNGTLTDNGYNLSSDDSCDFDESGASGSADSATLNLGGLSGGVHTPADPSDAIEAIPNGTTVNNNGTQLKCNQTTTDQLGNNRPINSWTGCTSGAVEVTTCTQPTAISNTAELYDCIDWANTVSAGADELGLDADVTLSTELPGIGTEITLDGGGYTVNGANTYGVFRVNGGGNFTVNNLTIQSGSSDYGGGIDNVGTLTVTNSTFSGNATSIRGGAILNVGTLTVTYSTFYDNSAPTGGAIRRDSGTVNLAGNIFEDGPSGSAQCNGAMTDNGYNLSSDNSCGFSGTGSANNATLNLGGLSSNVHTPADPSDAIGAIPYGTFVNNGPSDVYCTSTTADQLGATRPTDIAGLGPCTAGAVEVAVEICTNLLTISDETELANCITWANANPGADDLGLDADVTLSAALPTIDTEITLNGGGFSVDGDNSVRVFYVDTGGDFTIDNITIQNGNQAIGHGGGILNVGTAAVTNSTFSGNSANGGGGIYNSSAALTVTGSTFSGNLAVIGGAIYNTSTLTVTDSTFSGNSVPAGGAGAIYTTGAMTVTNSTFSDNSAPIGGAIVNEAGSMHLAGNLFATGASGANCENSGTFTDNGYNLSDDTTCTNGGTGSAINATLNLGVLSGGVHTPADPSDAIGVIPNGTSINNNGVTLACDQSTTDQLGTTRPADTLGIGPCTSGAVEVAVDICPTPLAISDETELADGITWANANPGADPLELDDNVTLSGTLPTIDTEITLNGGGFYVDGASAYQVFYVTAAGDLSVDNVTIQNGLVNNGGGGIRNAGTLTVTASTFSGNSSSGTGQPGGGGIRNVGTLTVTASTFSGNSPAYGGGIYNTSMLTVTDSTFSGNSAPSGPGGGMFNDGGTLTVTNSTLSGNSAGFGGGAFNFSGTLTVTNSTFYDNSGSGGGAIYRSGGTVYLAGNIFEDGPTGDAQCNGTMTDNSYNLSSDGSCGFSGTNANNATLNLGVLSGGVHTPGAGSDAIGVIPYGTTITNNTVSWTCNQSGFTDQLGGTRPIVTGDDCTSGAVEVALPPVACDISNSSITQTDATTAQLSWTNSGDGPAAEYRVFRSSSPYSGYVHLNETVTGTSHDVTIYPLQDYYYEVRGYTNAIDAPDDYSCKSGRFGVFSFTLVPGS